MEQAIIKTIKNYMTMVNSLLANFPELRRYNDNFYYERYFELLAIVQREAHYHDKK